VATARGSDWQLLRCDSYPACTGPVYPYTPISQPETADFYAILYGDVSGNWHQATSSLAATAQEDEAIAQDRVTAAELAGRGFQVPTPLPRTKPAALYMEHEGTIRGSGERVLYVQAEDS